MYKLITFWIFVFYAIFLTSLKTSKKNAKEWKNTFCCFNFSLKECSKVTLFLIERHFKYDSVIHVRHSSCSKFIPLAFIDRFIEYKQGYSIDVLVLLTMLFNLHRKDRKQQIIQMIALNELILYGANIQKSFKQKKIPTV